MNTLVVVDFSGTLSLEAVLFAREENLIKALRESGLWALGLKDETLFWKGLIAPTWPHGATTSIGYSRLLLERLKVLYQAPEEDIERCVAAFANRYFTRLRIHPAWASILHHLIERSNVSIMVATDHYAEATAYIVKQLQVLNIPADSLFQQHRRPPYERIAIVANSADIGYLKETKAYWNIVRQDLARNTWSQVLLIDDFGGNESFGDTYGTAEKIVERRQRTITILSEVFNCQIQVFTFQLQQKHIDETSIRKEFSRLIKDAEMFLSTCLPHRSP